MRGCFRCADPRHRANLLLLLMAIVSACGPLRRGPEGEQTVITFTNESRVQADLFAQTSGGPVRLGTIHPNRTEAFRLPESVMISAGGGVNFIARLFPSRESVATGRVTVTHGDRLLLRLPPGENILVVTPQSAP